MSTEKASSPASSQTAQRANVAFIGILILIVLVSAALYLFLPRPMADFLVTSLVIGLTVLLIAMGVQSWWWKRHSGAVVLDLGHAESSSAFVIALSLIAGVLSLYQYFTQDQREAYGLARTMFWFSAAVLAYFANRQPTLITARGWYRFDAQVPWDNIAAYQWLASKPGFAILDLQFKRRKFLASSAKFRIPAIQKVAVEQLLVQHIAPHAAVVRSY